MKNEVDSEHKRVNIKILSIVMCFLLGCLIWRFFQFGVKKEYNGHDLKASTEQVSKENPKVDQVHRGTIYDSKGQPIAQDITTYTVYAIINGDEKESVLDINHAAEVLSRHLDLSYSEVYSYLDNDEAYQVEFGVEGKNLSLKTKEAIEAEGVQGIKFTSQVNRRYVNDYYASHLIGYATNGENSESSTAIPEGKIGIEEAYDSVLSGRDRYQSGDKTLEGRDIYLTLDSRLQNHLEEYVDAAYKKTKPESIGGYLVEAKTGRLLASVQRPSFNLNTRDGIEKDWRNIIVQEANEPGSTIKILTTAVAQDLNLYTPTETFPSGSVTLYDGTEVTDYNIVGWGNITYDEGLARSSNTAMVYLVDKMELDVWRDKLKSFGFSQSTNSGLPDESAGYDDFNNYVSVGMSGFGQGFAATDMQLMQAFSSIGNQGQMLKIQYIDHIEDGEAFTPQVIGQPVTKEAAQHVLSVMQTGVEESYELVQPFKRSDISVAAKTGTGEIADPDGEGYLEGNGPSDYYYSVVAFFPAEDPEYMVYLYVKRPTETNNRNGSEVLADIFHPFVDKVLVGH